MDNLMLLDDAREWAKRSVLHKMEAEKLSQCQAAKQIGCSQPIISFLIHNPERITPSMIWQICKWVGKEPMNIILTPDTLSWRSVPIDKKYDARRKVI